MSNVQTEAVSKRAMLGSYTAEDCLFLLKPIEIEYQSIANKEQLIQSGQMHYSEMVHKETAPSKAYSELFLQMTARYKQRLARDVMRLAQLIVEQRDDITLLSLARAGTPIGVLVQCALRHFLKRQSTHYSISIIRDRGIDNNALDYVLAQGHKPESIVFIDGWTAKGVITRELHQAISAYNESRGVKVSPDLFVISDIGGTADVQATFDDYTIPSALMNSTVSGLVSRSILNAQVGPTDFHGCVRYTHLKEHDLSNWFVGEVFKEMQQGVMSEPCYKSKASIQATTQRFLTHVQEEYKVSDINRIKPGIAEATRVLLRRVPDQVLIRQRGHIDTQHLERLAWEKAVPIKEIHNMPFGACALIKDVL